MIGSGLDKVKQRVRVRLRPVILEGERKIYRHMRWVRDDELGGTESNFFDFNGVLNNLVWPVTIRSHGPHSSSQTRVPVIINAATTLTLYCVEWTQMTFFFFFFCLRSFSPWFVSFHGLPIVCLHFLVLSSSTGISHPSSSLGAFNSLYLFYQIQLICISIYLKSSSPPT